MYFPSQLYSLLPLERGKWLVLDAMLSPKSIFVDCAQSAREVGVIIQYGKYIYCETLSLFGFDRFQKWRYKYLSGFEKSNPSFQAATAKQFYLKLHKIYDRETRFVQNRHTDLQLF